MGRVHWTVSTAGLGRASRFGWDCSTFLHSCFGAVCVCVWGKVKGMIQEMVEKLVKEAEEEAGHKAHLRVL